MKKVLFFVLAVMITTSAMAQSRVTGKVTSSEDGSPLPFVTILIQEKEDWEQTQTLTGTLLSKDARTMRCWCYPMSGTHP